MSRITSILYERLAWHSSQRPQSSELTHLPPSVRWYTILTPYYPYVRGFVGGYDTETSDLWWIHLEPENQILWIVYPSPASATRGPCPARAQSGARVEDWRRVREPTGTPSGGSWRPPCAPHFKSSNSNSLLHIRFKYVLHLRTCVLNAFPYISPPEF